MQTRRHTGLASLCILGGGLHLLVVLAPLFATGDLARLIQPQRLAFLALLMLFHLAEQSQTARHDFVPRFRYIALGRLTHWLAVLTGLLLLAIFWIALSFGARVVSWPTAVLSAIGGILMMGGSALRYLAMRRLGNYFVSETAVQLGQSIVRDGIYRRLRHPSETGLLLVALGASLLLLSTLAVSLCAAILLPLIVVRIMLEERGLLAAFGPAYGDYQRQANRLVPFVF